MFDEMLVYLLGRALEDVGMESHRSIFIFRFMIMDYVILDFRTNVFLRFMICIIGLMVHGLYKYSKFGNLLVNFYLHMVFSIWQSFKLSSDDTVFPKLK